MLENSPYESRKLGDICSIRNGDRGVNYPSQKDFVPFGIPFVNAGHLKNGPIEMAKMNYISEESYNKLSAGKFSDGDILFCLRGTLGKYGRADKRFDRAVVASSLAILTPNPKVLDPDYLLAFLGSKKCQAQIEKWAGGAAQPNLSAENLRKFDIPLPDLNVQKRIAALISKIEEIVSSLIREISKKRDIKQGVMQQLLTGRTRLPGFEAEWKNAKISEIARVTNGSKNNQDKSSAGNYPFYVRSSQIETIDSWSFNCEAVLIPGEGRIGSIFHYANGKFDVHQRVYVIYRFSESVEGKFVHYYLRQFFGEHARANIVKATVDSIRMPTISNFEIQLPELDEQRQIVAVIESLEKEISALEQKLGKYKDIKQGMMQQLLTGRVRLPLDKEVEA